MVSASNLNELKSGLSPRVSREPSLAQTLALASGDPEQRAQLSHARLLTYKTVSYEIYVALSCYVCGNMLMATTETNALGGGSPGPQHKLIPSLLHFLYLVYEL